MKKGLKALGTSGWPKIQGKKRKIQLDGRDGDRGEEEEEEEEEEEKNWLWLKKQKKGSPRSYSAPPSALGCPYVFILYLL